MAPKAKTIEDLFIYSAVFSDLLPIIALLIFWKSTSSNKGLWIVISYCLYDFLTNLALMSLTHKATKVLLYRSFTLIEYLLFAYFLSTTIKNLKFRTLMLICSISFAVFLITYYLTTKVKGIDSVNIGIETILILLFSFYFFYEQLNEKDNQFIYSKPSFWIVLGMMLYLSGCFFIYIYAPQLTQNQLNQYWIFTNIFSILKNIFFTLAVVMIGNNAKKKQPIKYSLYPAK